MNCFQNCIFDLSKTVGKETDNKSIIGYLNYKCFVIIDNKKECLRVAIKFQNDGKFYYNIEVNKEKNKK